MAVVLDLFSRKIVGWSFSASLDCCIIRIVAASMPAMHTNNFSTTAKSK
jgi:hypothetical protein